MRIVFILVLPLFLFTACGPNLEKSDRLVEEGAMLSYYAKYQEAIEVFDEAIKLNPDNFEAYYSRGNAKASLRKYEEAIEDYSLAIKFHPKYADAYTNRGQMKFYLNDREGACDDWKFAESLGKENLGDKTRFCN